MGGSGIVRRIDELGRIVIPKEMRKTLRLREGDEMEISANGDKLELRKYSALSNAAAAVQAVGALLNKQCGGDIAFLSAKGLGAYVGKSKKQFERAELKREDLDEFFQKQELYLQNIDTLTLFGVESDFKFIYSVSISANGDGCGSICLFKTSQISDECKTLINAAAQMLGAVLL